MSKEIKTLQGKSLERLIWIVKELLNNPDGMTAVELTNSYNETHDDSFDRKSCYNYFEYASDYLGINIGHKDSTSKFYLLNPEVFKDDTVTHFVYKTLNYGDMVYDCKSLAGRVFLEPMYKGVEFLHVILKSMKRNKKIVLQYKKFNSDIISVVDLEPYCVKSYLYRLYILGKNDDGKLRTYSFDRFQGLKMSDDKFEYDQTFDAEEYYSDCFGIIKDENCHPRRIVLKVKKHQVEYLRQAPLHSSQKEICYGDDWANFEYYLRPTKDFIAAILRQGQYIEILEPSEVRTEVRRELWEAYKAYYRIRIGPSFLKKAFSCIFAL